MNEAGCPQADAHNRAYKFLLDELRHLKKQIIEGKVLHAFYFLMDWLIAHIENDDKSMGVFLQGKMTSVQDDVTFAACLWLQFVQQQKSAGRASYAG